MLYSWHPNILDPSRGWLANSVLNSPLLHATQDSYDRRQLVKKKNIEKDKDNFSENTTYCKSKTAASSDRTKPIRKCCWRYSPVNSAKRAELETPTNVETNEDWLFDEDTDGEGDGDEAVELHKGVE